MQYRPTADYLLAYESVIKAASSSSSTFNNSGGSPKLRDQVRAELKEFIDSAHAMNMTVLIQVPILDEVQAWSEEEVRHFFFSKTF